MVNLRQRRQTTNTQQPKSTINTTQSQKTSNNTQNIVSYNIKDTNVIPTLSSYYASDRYISDRSTIRSASDSYSHNKRHDQRDDNDKNDFDTKKLILPAILPVKLEGRLFSQSTTQQLISQGILQPTTNSSANKKSKIAGSTIFGKSSFSSNTNNNLSNILQHQSSSNISVKSALDLPTLYLKQKYRHQITQNNLLNQRKQNSSIPSRVLDAPGIIDDFYLSLLDWSPNPAVNLVAIALSSSVYLWNDSVKKAGHLATFPSNLYISSVHFINGVNNGLLAIGKSDGEVVIWDIAADKILTQMTLPRDGSSTTMANNSKRIAVMSSNNNGILSCGSRIGSIYNYDILRSSSDKPISIYSNPSSVGSEICGLKYSHVNCEQNLDGLGNSLLASGGNDNVVNIWDGRGQQSLLAVIPSASASASASVNGNEHHQKISSFGHKAAVKALDWSPFKPYILATGGGTSDHTLKLWNTVEINSPSSAESSDSSSEIIDHSFGYHFLRSSSHLHTLPCPSLISSTDTGSQICTLMFSKSIQNEILTSHGFSKYQLCIWKISTSGKSMKSPLFTIDNAHANRVLYTAQSPDGSTVVSCSGDENLKFWSNIWPSKKQVEDEEKRKEKDENRNVFSDKSGQARITTSGGGNFTARGEMAGKASAASSSAISQKFAEILTKNNN